ncbi:MAG: response regulator transcription factor [Clostridiales bacterium]|nr:response regulator transcription factor [Clostridiales bacterium]
MDNKVKTILVEDDKDFAFLIRKMITQDPRLEYLGHATNKAVGVEMAHMLQPDIVVMDLNLSGKALDGIEAAKEIRLTTGAKILLLTSYEQPDVIITASKRAFASGYVFKSQCQNLTDIIYETATSNTPQEGMIKELLLKELSPAERSILTDMLEANADKLSLSSAKTVANQKTSIFRKLGFKNTRELISVFKNW